MLSFGCLGKGASQLTGFLLGFRSPDQHFFLKGDLCDDPASLQYFPELQAQNCLTCCRRQEGALPLLSRSSGSLGRESGQKHCPGCVPGQETQRAHWGLNMQSGWNSSLPRQDTRTPPLPQRRICCSWLCSEAGQRSQMGMLGYRWPNWPDPPT